MCQEILDHNSHDEDNRIMLSKCQREMFQFELAEENHLIAKSKYPYSSKVLENEACHLFEHCDFEKSMNIFAQGNKKMDIDHHFKMEVGKVWLIRLILKHIGHKIKITISVGSSL